MSDYQHEAIDTPEARLHALAGALYYVASKQAGFETVRLFETLPREDQRFFEKLVGLALEAAAFWRLSADCLPDHLPLVPSGPHGPAPTVASRPGLTLVRPILSEGT